VSGGPCAEPVTQYERSKPLIMITLSLRAHIGVVPQSPATLDDTVMNNVRCARGSATDEEVVEACKAALIHARILDLTDGTSLGGPKHSDVQQTDNSFRLRDQVRRAWCEAVE
jgi:hypothetical protein